MAASRRTRKKPMDYSVLSGKRKHSIQSRVQDTRGRRTRASQLPTGIHYQTLISRIF